MNTRIVFSKTSRRVMFACDPTAFALWESLWPSTAFVYTRIWVPPPLMGIRTDPWNFLFQSPDVLVESVEAPSPETILNFNRARLLMSLARSIDRQRRAVLKTDIPGQAEVYAMKVAQATRVINGAALNSLDTVPLVTADAELHGITIEQAARLIMVKSSQSSAYLVESEIRRRQFTRRILEADSDSLDNVAKEIIAYGNQY